MVAGPSCSFVLDAKGMEKSSGAAHGCWVQMFYDIFFLLLKVIDNILALVIIMIVIMPEGRCLREG